MTDLLTCFIPSYLAGWVWTGLGIGSRLEGDVYIPLSTNQRLLCKCYS